MSSGNNQITIERIDAILRSAVVSAQREKERAAAAAKLAPVQAKALADYLTAWAEAVNDEGIVKSTLGSGRLSVRTVFNRNSRGGAKEHHVQVAIGSILKTSIAGAVISDRIYAGGIHEEGDGSKLDGKAFDLKDLEEAKLRVEQAVMAWLVRNNRIDPETLADILEPEL